MTVRFSFYGLHQLQNHRIGTVHSGWYTKPPFRFLGSFYENARRMAMCIRYFPAVLFNSKDIHDNSDLDRQIPLYMQRSNKRNQEGSNRVMSIQVQYSQKREIIPVIEGLN